jgi:cytochrome P450
VLREFFGDRSLLLLEPAEHLGRRRLELPSFHGEQVRAYGDRIRELADAEVEGWRVCEVVAVQGPARQLTLAVILELVLGVRDSGLRGQLAAIIDAFDTPLQNLAQFMPEWFKRRSWWNLPGRLAYARLDRLHALLEEHVASSRADPALDQRKDVLARLLVARDEAGAALTDLDLRDELLTLVLAGHETTATAIAWSADLLAHNPRVAVRLRESLAAANRDYLKATAKEVLRARTVAYVSAGRVPLEPIPVGDWVIGHDALILVDAQGVHADPELYPDPTAFRPERFLGGQPDGYSYLPFGGGAHRCLGTALAMLELELAIEAITTRIGLAPAGPPAKPVRRGVTLGPSGGAKVRIAARV